MIYAATRNTQQINVLRIYILLFHDIPKNKIKIKTKPTSCLVVPPFNCQFIS